MAAVLALLLAVMALHAHAQSALFRAPAGCTSTVSLHPHPLQFPEEEDEE